MIMSEMFGFFFSKDFTLDRGTYHCFCLHKVDVVSADPSVSQGRSSRTGFRKVRTLALQTSRHCSPFVSWIFTGVFFVVFKQCEAKFSDKRIFKSFEDI